MTDQPRPSSPCEGDCNPFVAPCGAKFCSGEEMREHLRDCHIAQPATSQPSERPEPVSDELRESWEAFCRKLASSQRDPGPEVMKILTSGLFDAYEGGPRMPAKSERPELRQWCGTGTYHHSCEACQAERPEPLKADPWEKFKKDIELLRRACNYCYHLSYKDLEEIVGRLDEVDTAHAAEQAELVNLRAEVEKYDAMRQAYMDRRNQEVDTLKATHAEEVRRLQVELETLHDNVHRHLGIALSRDGNTAFLDGAGEVPLQEVFKETRAEKAEAECSRLQAELERLKAAQSIEPHTVPKPDRRQVGRLE